MYVSIYLSMHQKIHVGQSLIIIFCFTLLISFKNACNFCATSVTKNNLRLQTSFPNTSHLLLANQEIALPQIYFTDCLVAVSN